MHTPFAFVIIHIFCPVLVDALAGGNTLFRARDRRHQTAEAREDQSGNRRIRVTVTGDQLLFQAAKAASQIREAPEPASLPRRRGNLQPPAPPLRNTEAGELQSRVRTPRGSTEPVVHSPAAKVAGSTIEKQGGRSRRMNEYHRKAAASWTFRGPKPFPILSDSRLTDEDKESELVRIMEKLHLEFFMKQRMGHSRLQQARTAFYRAANDYTKLTGRPHPPDFNYEELPGISEGAELEQEDADDDSSINVETTNIVLVPDSMPECLSSCKRGGARCYSDANAWTAEEACTCLKAWQTCALETCTEELDTNGFFTALNTREAEVCVWPQGKLYSHLHIDKLTHRPVNTSIVTDPGDAGESSFVQRRSRGDDLSSLGVGLASLLDAGALQEEEADPKFYKTRAPTGCRVSNPEMLGDGNCDGGAYNTAECNYDGGDCCDADCRPAHHRCGLRGYQCAGFREAVKVHKNFICNKERVSVFRDYFDMLRDELTLGRAMITAQCKTINQEEHNNAAQAFNLGVELQWSAAINSAAAAVGGPTLMIDCDPWDNEMGSDWFGTLITHELGHMAGYSHPKFKTSVYNSQCENIGSDYCHGHCMEWTSACQNHLIFGSQTCGFANTGCKTTCVHSDYCHSLPERMTECFGYQKVHSRGETMSEIVVNTVNTVVTKVSENPMLGLAGVTAVFSFLCCLFFTVSACRSCCASLFGRRKKPQDKQRRKSAAGQAAEQSARENMDAAVLQNDGRSADDSQHEITK